MFKMHTLVLLALATGVALSTAAMAQEKVPELDEKAFAADYRALLKKHPGATYRFHLFDERDAKGGRSPRCAVGCHWHPEVGVCSCPPPMGEVIRLWE